MSSFSEETKQYLPILFIFTSSDSEGLLGNISRVSKGTKMPDSPTLAVCFFESLTGYVRMSEVTNLS